MAATGDATVMGGGVAGRAAGEGWRAGGSGAARGSEERSGARAPPPAAAHRPRGPRGGDGSGGRSRMAAAAVGTGWGWIRRRRDALRRACWRRGGRCEPGWRSRCEADSARRERRAKEIQSNSIRLIDLLMMSTTRRFVYLLLEEFGRRRSNYTLRNIDMDRFFLPRPSPVPYVASAADAVEYASLPCPAMTFNPPFSTLFGNQKMEFLLLGGNHNNAVVAVDQTCRTVLYDPGEHAVRTMPALPYQVRLPTTSVTVGDDLYILDTSRRHVNDDGGGNDWRCHALPPPPPPLSHKSDLHVHSYAVVGDTEIWMSSTHGSGIYCFDTVSHVWSTVATGWKLPFVGLAEYCHEHGLWFGLSCSTGDRRRSLVLSALDLDGTKLPVLHRLPLEFTPPDALNLVSSYLVNLGAGKFCIARFFQTDEDHRDGEELFAVLTAVEVERCDDDDDDAGGGANGGGLRMLKHRSEMYKLASEMMYWTLLPSKDMPRLGDPDADLIRRVLWEIGYIYCIYINRDKTSLFLCSQNIAVNFTGTHLLLLLLLPTLISFFAFHCLALTLSTRVLASCSCCCERTEDGMFRGIYHGKQCHAADIPAVIARAWAAGVDRIIVTGGSLKESREVLEIAETDGELSCLDAGCFDYVMLGAFKVFVVMCPRSCDVLGRCRDAEFEESGDPEGHFQALLALAKVEIAKGKVCVSLVLFPGGVTHSFTGTAEDRDKLLSFEKMFIERMMIETDSPYCDIKNTHAGIKFVKSVWPSKKKEKYEPDSTVKGRNEPCLVRQVLEVVAGCKGISDIEGLSKTLYHNTCRLISDPINHHQDFFN
uniref:Uncharacterized protein n=1 Tax=Oryza meridionalis TaxID=40149 RepID=A0A0E0EID7_9ORYZ